MAYFNQEMKKILVERLKEGFPDWKFSVKVSDHSKLMVAVKSAPIDLWANYVENIGEENLYGDNGSAQINHYYLERCFSGESLEKMNLLLEHMNLTGDEKHENYCESDVRSDYVSVGYFISLRIGQFDKPFEHTPQVNKRKVKKM